MGSKFTYEVKYELINFFDLKTTKMKNGNIKTLRHAKLDFYFNVFVSLQKVTK